MTDHSHPIRGMRIHVFGRDAISDEGGVLFVARFFPYDKFPIFFSGNSAEQAREKAEDFRQDVIEKNEETYRKRMAALDKARAARKKKEKQQ